MHLERYEHECEAFLRRVITINETWIRSYTPELKRQPNEWRHTESPRPKRCRALQDPSKLIIIVCYDYESIIVIYTVPHGTRVNEDYYSRYLEHHGIVNDLRPLGVLLCYMIILVI